MRCLVLIAVGISVAVARPETYREKEDFQYSRSSSDDGSKSGYYGAQRGNMGGNYERAHNMDNLAQHQMSGLIHQTEGELGDTSNTNAGSVFTAANSRGMYGSGHLDLSNLEGRNFQEGNSYGDSQSQSALSNSAYRNHASASNSYSNSNSYSHSSKHSSSDRSEHEQRKVIQNSHLRSGESAYQQEHGAYGGSSSQDYSWSPYQNRLVSNRPMRILIRPGTNVAAPVATQTYDAGHHASSYDSSAYNHNAAKSDAEIIVNNDHDTITRQVPTSKHYESSYSYRKEWEKHHSSPSAAPLDIDVDSSIPKTSELYDDSQHSQINKNHHQYASNAADSLSHHSSNSYGYNSRSNLDSSSQSKHQSDYDIERQRLSSALNSLNLNTQQSNLNQDNVNQQDSINAKPKSYQSSYSYHKSWERQGDPYVIVPVPDVQNGQASQRLSTASNSPSGYSSHQYGINRKQSHQSYTSSNGLMDCDCDEEGHIRVARSYNPEQEVQQQQNGWDDDQQSQDLWSGQQSQQHWDGIEDLGQQSQDLWSGQQSQQQWDKIEDLGQQTQKNVDKIEDLGQQSQQQWDKIEDLGQHSQNLWSGQQSQRQLDKIEDLGQHSQDLWSGQQSQQQLDKIEDLGQHSQDLWSGQQSQQQLDKIEDLGQHSQDLWSGQQSQQQWDKIEDLGQQNKNNFDKIEDLGQQTQHQWDKVQDLGQQTQNNVDKIEDLGQQSQNPWNKYNQFEQQSQSNVGQEQATWNQVDNLNEDKHIHEIYRDQSRSNKFDDDVTHHTDNQTEISHKEQKEEQQNYFNTYLPDDFHTHQTDESLSDSRTHTSINSLWDKLDRLSRESTFNSNHDTNEYTSFTENKHQFNLPKESPTTEVGVVTDKTIVHSKYLGRGDIPDTTVIQPKNIGRGDIPDTPEGLDFLKYSITTENINEVSTSTSSYNKRNKSQDGTLMEIEALSLTAKHHEITEKPKRILEETNMVNKTEISNQQSEHSSNSHSSNYHLQGENLEEKDQQSTSNLFQSFNIEQQPSEKYNKLHSEQEKDVSKLNENNDQQYITHNNGGFAQQSENLEQHNMQQESQKFEKPVEIVGQQNLDQNLVDFSKWNENLAQHSINQHQGDLEPQTQQNVEQELQSFDKPLEIVDQQNLAQNLVYFNKWNENLDQQSTNNHAESYDQQNIEQGLQSFDKPSDSFDQQNLVDSSKFRENVHQGNMNDSPNSFHQHNANLEHQNMEQELQNFEKQSLNQNLENFNQFSQNAQRDAQMQSVDQPPENFQYSENLSQQNMGQELQSFNKLSNSFDQHNKYHQNDFNLQTENLLQQNNDQELQNFQNPRESFDQQNLNQNLVEFDQQSMSNNFDHQNENLEKQDMGQELQNFDKPDDIFDQQNLNQNLEDFSQFNEKFDHHYTNQGLQDLIKPTDNSDQQQNQNFIDLKQLDHFQQQSYNEQFDFRTGRENYHQPMHQNLRSLAPESEIVQKHTAKSNSEHLDVQQNNDKMPTQQTEEYRVLQTTLAPEPEKTGFWASVGKKFTNAKDKVSSWFTKKSD